MVTEYGITIVLLIASIWVIVSALTHKNAPPSEAAMPQSMATDSSALPSSQPPAVPTPAPSPSSLSDTVGIETPDDQSSGSVASYIEAKMPIPPLPPPPEPPNPLPPKPPFVTKDEVQALIEDLDLKCRKALTGFIGQIASDEVLDAMVVRLGKTVNLKARIDEELKGKGFVTESELKEDMKALLDEYDFTPHIRTVLRETETINDLKKGLQEKGFVTNGEMVTVSLKTLNLKARIDEELKGKGFVTESELKEAIENLEFVDEGDVERAIDNREFVTQDDLSRADLATVDYVDERVDNLKSTNKEDVKALLDEYDFTPHIRTVLREEKTINDLKKGLQEKGFVTDVEMVTFVRQQVAGMTTHPSEKQMGELQARVGDLEEMTLGRMRSVEQMAIGARIEVNATRERVVVLERALAENKQKMDEMGVAIEGLKTLLDEATKKLQEKGPLSLDKLIGIRAKDIIGHYYHPVKTKGSEMLIAKINSFAPKDVRTGFCGAVAKGTVFFKDSPHFVQEVIWKVEADETPGKLRFTSVNSPEPLEMVI